MMHIKMSRGRDKILDHDFKVGSVVINNIHKKL